MKTFIMSIISIDIILNLVYRSARALRLLALLSSNPVHLVCRPSRLSWEIEIPKVGKPMNSRAVILAVALVAPGAMGFAQTATPPESSPAKAPASMTAALSSDGTPDPVQPASTQVSQTRPVSFHRDGLWFSAQDGQTRLQVHGYTQADDRMFYANIHGEPLDTFLFRRIRPLFEGTLFNNVDFRFMPDFGQNNPQIQEAFLELKTLRFAKLRVGKFKEPIGLEVLRQDRDLTFVERSMASDLLPLRYIGAQISGSVLSDS